MQMSEQPDDPLVMYIVVRKDLKGWPKGALISQGSHGKNTSLITSYT